MLSVLVRSLPTPSVEGLEGRLGRVDERKGEGRMKGLALRANWDNRQHMEGRRRGVEVQWRW